jgi:hypothetical protein
MRMTKKNLKNCFKSRSFTQRLFCSELCTALFGRTLRLTRREDDKERQLLLIKRVKSLILGLAKARSSWNMFKSSSTMDRAVLLLFSPPSLTKSTSSTSSGALVSLVVDQIRSPFLLSAQFPVATMPSTTLATLLVVSSFSPSAMKLAAIKSPSAAVIKRS